MVQDKTVPDESANVRPWVRFFARHMDILFFISIMTYLFNALSPPFPSFAKHYLAPGMFFCFLWSPVEALLLSTWGTTPGKWLLKTTLRDSRGSKLTYPVAFKRSLYVWERGLGIWFPYSCAVAEVFSYQNLKDYGVTKWDRDGEFVISHGKIDAFRIIAAIMLAGLAVFAMFLN